MTRKILILTLAFFADCSALSTLCSKSHQLCCAALLIVKRRVVVRCTRHYAPCTLCSKPHQHYCMARCTMHYALWPKPHQLCCMVRCTSYYALWLMPKTPSALLHCPEKGRMHSDLEALNPLLWKLSFPQFCNACWYRSKSICIAQNKTTVPSKASLREAKL